MLANRIKNNMSPRKKRLIKSLNYINMQKNKYTIEEFLRLIPYLKRAVSYIVRDLNSIKNINSFNIDVYTLTDKIIKMNVVPGGNNLDLYSSVKIAHIHSIKCQIIKELHKPYQAYKILDTIEIHNNNRVLYSGNGK